MNLNRIKRGFSTTKPEKGLRDLVGARKSQRRENDPGTIRVSGQYIPPNTDNAGKVFGLMSFIHACIYVILLPCSILAGQKAAFSPIAVFFLGLAIVHGCALFADSLRHSEAPWARRAIKTFWINTGCWGVIVMIIALT